MRPLVTAAEMRALDRAVIDDVGLPAIALMETAGRAVARAALEMLAGPARTDGGSCHIAVVCGIGNNGGDGFVAARVLRDRGHDAVVYLAGDRAKVSGDAAAHLLILERAGGVVRTIDSPRTLAEVGEAIGHAALVIDALFGVGLARPIEGHLAEVVALMSSARRRLAVDLPSGLDADTGRVLGVAVTADRTVTMAALKIALASSPGFARCGAIEVADIGVPVGVVATQGVRAGLVEESDLVGWLPRPTPLDHKGRRGHVVVVAGTATMRGAGRLAAMAALRSGAGLVTLANDAPTADDSIMTVTLAAGDGITGLLADKSAVVIGPGLGQGEAAAAWVREVLAAGIPAVLDADALNLVAARPDGLHLLARAAGSLVLTPHPGEAARLLDTTVAGIEADRLAAARALAARSRAVIVLKGARTIVCDGTLGDDYCTINPTGGPELATGGSGDVLAGVIGALLAQGVPADLAARAAAFVHGRAGERLAAVHGTRGVISSDLPVAIAGVFAEIPRPA